MEAPTAELARRAAADRVSGLLDVLFGLDGEPVWHRFHPGYAVAIDGSGKARMWTGQLRGRPDTRADAADVETNAIALARLRQDARPWCRQLVRALHLLRLAENAGDDELRFLHGWRALESLVGHLTGPEAGKWREELIVLARCACSEGYVGATEDKGRRSVFDREAQSVRRDLSSVMAIRNHWALHTGDERATALDDVDPEALGRACEWLCETGRMLFFGLVEIALGPAAPASRDALHRHMASQLRLPSRADHIADSLGRSGCLGVFRWSRRPPRV